MSLGETVPPALYLGTSDSYSVLDRYPPGSRFVVENTRSTDIAPSGFKLFTRGYIVIDPNGDNGHKNYLHAAEKKINAVIRRLIIELIQIPTESYNGALRLELESKLKWAKEEKNKILKGMQPVLTQKELEDSNKKPLVAITIVLIIAVAAIIFYNKIVYIHHPQINDRYYCLKV